MDPKAQWALVAAAWIFALGLLFLLWRHWGAPLPPAGAAAPFPATAGAGLAVDPVSGATVAMDESLTAYAIYKGRKYWFSRQSAGGFSDKMLFLMNPERYLGGPQGAPSPGTATAAAQPASSTPSAPAPLSRAADTLP